MTSVAVSFGAILPLVSQAQQQNPVQLERDLTEQFVEGFNEGCMRGKTPGVSDQPAS